jgi:hypothetical protein
MRIPHRKTRFSKDICIPTLGIRKIKQQTAKHFKAPTGHSIDYYVLLEEHTFGNQQSTLLKEQVKKLKIQPNKNGI